MSITLKRERIITWSIILIAIIYIIYSETVIDSLKSELVTPRADMPIINRASKLASADMKIDENELFRLTRAHVFEMSTGPCVVFKPRQGVYGGSHAYCFESFSGHNLLSKHISGQ